MPIYSELAALLDDVADRVDRWTRQEAWEPEPGSPGAAELANIEVRADGTPWGERPIIFDNRINHHDEKLERRAQQLVPPGRVAGTPVMGSRRPRKR